LPRIAEGEFALVKERLAGSLTLSGQPVKRGTMAHEHIVYMMMVDAMALAEDREGIAVYAPRLVELAERDDHRPYLAVARRALGVAARLAGELDEARRLLNAALDEFSEREMRWQAGRTHLELGRLELVRGSDEQAEAYFSEALETLQQTGSKPFMEQALTELEAIRHAE
jgi:tetratricopeptide (TPR) repeat protein